MISDPDSELIKRLAAGEVDAMQAMVTRKLPSLLALAARMLGDPGEAEDVVQETFIRIWKHAGRWQPGKARFDTWIYRVTLNLCHDRLKKRRAYPSVDVPEDYVDQASHSNDTDIDGRDIERALQALAARQREAIVLVYYHDLSNREAAEVMQITVEALESLLSRGRRALKLILGEAL